MKQIGSDGGWSPLHLAAHYGQVDVVKKLIQCGADLNALADNKEGNTPLMASVAGGNITVIRVLLESDADPLKHDKDGSFNAIKLAEQDKKNEIVDLLKSFVKSSH